MDVTFNGDKYYVSIIPDPFHFSYRIGLVLQLEWVFFGMIYITKRGWFTPILKVIQGIFDSYLSTPKT